MRLQRDAGSIQAALLALRAGAREVGQAESGKRLTREEARRATELRWEQERLRLELRRLHEELAALREEQQGKGAAP